MYRFPHLVPVLGAAILLAALCFIKPPDGSPADVPIHRSDFLLNTFVDIAIYDSRDESILDGAMALCREYENRFSRTLSGSEVYRLNHREDATGTYPLSDDMTDLLATALYYCERSGGAFDITTEPLSSLWNFSGTSPEVPPAAAIEEARKKVDYKKLRLDGTRSTLTFLDPGTSIDLGAIAKGYIADRLKAYLLDSGVDSAMSHLGGNVLCMGSRPDGTPFTVGLQKPFADRNETFAQVEVSDLSVVASGVYERHFVEDGKNYHHILDPSTGYPYDNGLISVTILSERSVDGDALSTTCFSLGLSRGMELVESMDGVPASLMRIIRSTIPTEWKNFYERIRSYGPEKQTGRETGAFPGRRHTPYSAPFLSREPGLPLRTGSVPGNFCGRDRGGDPGAS